MMLVQAGIKDGAKLNIAETTAFREHQAQAQAAQEQEALTQRQQAQAVQQVQALQLTQQLPKHESGTLLQLHVGNLSTPVLLCIRDIALDLLQEIREQHSMRLQVEVITAQVNQLAEQVCSTLRCAPIAKFDPLFCCQASALQSYMTEYILNASIMCQLMQAQQLQQQLHQQQPAISHKVALQLGEALTQKLIQLDNVQVTGMNYTKANKLAFPSELVQFGTRIFMLTDILRVCR